MDVSNIRLQSSEPFVRARDSFEIEFEVSEISVIPDAFDNFKKPQYKLDGKARILFIGYALVQRPYGDPVFYEFSNEERTVDASSPGWYTVQFETPITYPSTIKEQDFEIGYMIRVSLKPWIENDFMEKEIMVIRPVTRFDRDLHNRKLETGGTIAGGERTNKAGDMLGVSATIQDPRAFATGEDIQVNYNLHNTASRKMVKKSVCQLIRLTKLKVPGSGGDNVVEFSRVLSSKDISNDSGSGQVSLPIDAQIPSLEGCATTVHWNILHIYYFVRLKVTMVDRKAIQVDLPVLVRGGVDIDDDQNDGEDANDPVPTDIKASMYSPSLKRIASIQKVLGRYIFIHSVENAKFPLLRVFCRGEAIVRKPATAETRYTFLDHRTDFFDFELLAGENKVPVGFEDEAIDTFVNDKMMPMSFQSPWVAVEYMCRIYGLKNDDFIDLEFDWEPYKCPGFDAALNQVSKRADKPVHEEEVAVVGKNKSISAQVNLESAIGFVGEPISVNARVVNESSKRIEQVVAQLAQTVRYRVPNRHKMHYEEFTRVISEVEAPDLVWEDMKLHLPGHIPPTVHCDWDIVQISYTFFLRVVTKGVTKPLLHVVIPMFISDRGAARTNSVSMKSQSHIHLEDHPNGTATDDTYYEDRENTRHSFRSERPLTNGEDLNNDGVADSYTDDDEPVDPRGASREASAKSQRSLPAHARKSFDRNSPMPQNQSRMNGHPTKQTIGANRRRMISTGELSTDEALMRFRAKSRQRRQYNGRKGGPPNEWNSINPKSNKAVYGGKKLFQQQQNIHTQPNPNKYDIETVD